jgi:N-acetylglucosaminyldiphosphoundecaprenol N-acetyl-beta-D-mannosaminyltransferase
MKIETVNILGVRVARMGMSQVLEWIRIMIDQGRPRHIVTANAEIIYKAYREPDFRRIIGNADLVTPDGSGVVWASKTLGQPVPERVTGIDLIHKLFACAEVKGWRIYFLGAKPEVVEKAVLNTLGKSPKLHICGYHHGFFCQEEESQVVSNIVKEKPDILLVALGAPKQEQFIQKYIKELNVPISIGVGGSFDVLAGVAERAPESMQKYGLEWLYRLYKEPKRYKRMLALPRFVLAVLRQRLGSK